MISRMARRADLRALRAAIDGFCDKCVEAHALDAKTAKRIPRKPIGRSHEGRGGGAA
jgi:AhpD family alkylhydroperoxidase